MRSPMSVSNELLTERQRIIVEALGRQWLEGNRDGFDQAAAILTDLIAELVGDDGDGHELTGDDEDGCQVCAAIDRAETRLRKVTDE